MPTDSVTVDRCICTQPAAPSVHCAFPLDSEEFSGWGWWWRELFLLPFGVKISLFKLSHLYFTLAVLFKGQIWEQDFRVTPEHPTAKWQRIPRLPFKHLKSKQQLLPCTGRSPTSCHWATHWVHYSPVQSSEQSYKANVTIRIFQLEKRRNQKVHVTGSSETHRPLDFVTMLSPVFLNYVYFSESVTYLFLYLFLSPVTMYWGPEALLPPFYTWGLNLTSKWWSQNLKVWPLIKPRHSLPIIAPTSWVLMIMKWTKIGKVLIAVPRT